MSISGGFRSLVTVAARERETASHGVIMQCKWSPLTLSSKGYRCTRASVSCGTGGSLQNTENLKYPPRVNHADDAVFLFPLHLFLCLLVCPTTEFHEDRSHVLRVFRARGIEHTGLAHRIVKSYHVRGPSFSLPPRFRRNRGNMVLRRNLDRRGISCTSKGEIRGYCSTRNKNIYYLVFDTIKGEWFETTKSFQTLISSNCKDVDFWTILAKVRYNFTRNATRLLYVKKRGSCVFRLQCAFDSIGPKIVN